MEELSTSALDALDRTRTVVLLAVSPLEEHGPHLPVGVDAFAARYLAESVARRIVEGRPGWAAVIAPTLHVGSFTFEATGTLPVRQRVVRDLLVDYGEGLARAGFRHVLVSNGHGGPGHLVALEEAASRVSRRHGIVMASITGHLMWDFLRGRFLDRIESALGRPLSWEEKQAVREDSHGGLWETSVMLWLRPDLVDSGFRSLPAARYSPLDRLRPNYPLRGGGTGYAGHPALADASFARATMDVLLDEIMALVDGLLDRRLGPRDFRSPFSSIPLLRTNFWPVACAALAGLALLSLLRRPR